MIVAMPADHAPIRPVPRCALPRMRWSVPLLPAIVMVAGLEGGCAGQPSLAAPPAAPQGPARFEQRLEGTTAALTMILVPGDKPFYIASTETTWDLYDLFVFRLDDEDPADKGEDAVTRPSKPYIPPDRGFGHAGYPAISMTARGAEEFCAWLSQRTGHLYRLPTEQEWERACQLGAGPAAAAWTRENSGNKTHPVGSRAPDALGLFDMAGNVAEWVVAADGTHAARGGSYLDPAASVGCSSRIVQTPEWNASDPQFPKSRWWLADCTFVGYRVVCDAAPAAPANPPEHSPKKGSP
jgi:formylglycine-generating enzyme required for sulfatase activity